MFSAVNASRTSESLTRVQRVPVQTIGRVGRRSRTFSATTHWSAASRRGTSAVPATRSHTLTIVSTARYRIGRAANDRWLIFPGPCQDQAANWCLRAASDLTAGKTTPRRALLTRWQPNQTAVTAFPDRTETAVSPQGSALYHLTDAWALYGSVLARAFARTDLERALPRLFAWAMC